MCDKTTERFKRPSFSVIFKRKRRTPKLCNKKQNPSGYILTINNTWGLGPKVFDIEKSPVFVAAAGEEGIVTLTALLSPAVGKMYSFSKVTSWNSTTWQREREHQSERERERARERESERERAREREREREEREREERERARARERETERGRDRQACEVQFTKRKGNTALGPERLASLLFILQFTREIKRK